jgi:hypothetical protein
MKQLSRTLYSLHRIEEDQERQAGPQSPLESEGRLNPIFYPAAPWG